MKIILILVITHMSCALHNQHQSSQISTHQEHLQTSTKTLYFQNQFNAIKSKIDYVYRALTINNTQNYQYLTARIQQTLAGINQIHNTLVKYNLTITLADKSCPKLTTFNRTQLRRYISYTQIKQQLMEDFLATCQTCQFISNDILSINNLTKNYIAHLNSTLDGVYCPNNRAQGQVAVGMVNLNLSFFKSNLNANNWYYGSTTSSDYKLYIFKLSSTYNLTNCPIQRPYVKESKQICFDCPQNSMFNIGKQECDICKPNQILNLQTASCIKCYGDKVRQGKSLFCRLCMISQGYIFNQTIGKCKKCDQKSYLNVIDKKCISINCTINAPKFNRATNQCQPCGLSQIIDPKNVSQCIKTNFIGLCQPDTPFYDMTEHICKACPNNTVYSQTNNQCLPKTNSHFTQIQPMNSKVINITSISVACSPDKPKYNTTTKLCQECQQGFSYNPKRGDCVKPLICSDTQTADQDNLNCIKTSSTCSLNEVYILKINRCVAKSITCSEDEFYSRENQTCVQISSTCKKSQYYDSKLKICRLISSKCTGYQIFNKKLSICEKLILCNESQYYNSELKICEKRFLKCQKNQFYDQSSNTCKNYQILTSPFAPNLIVTGNYQKYLVQYNQFKSKANDSVIDCPQSTPFFQKSSSRCISCPQAQPYFNLQDDKCISCTQQKQYNIITHKCTANKANSQQLTSRISQTISRIAI